MYEARIRFYAELNDFLPRNRRKVEFPCRFCGAPPVKDLIEAQGVPHTEVDLVLVNGRSVDFSCPIRNGDRISVYPVFESIDITPVVRVRPKALRVSRFTVDGHLGKLARHLRLLGFDVFYHQDVPDEELARIAAAEGRILLTRDRDLLKRRLITHGYWVRQTEPRLQLLEVLRRFDLAGSIEPFKRCMRCNGLLESVRSEDVADGVPERIRQAHETVSVCGGCGQPYWEGSHHARLDRFVREIRRELAQTARKGDAERHDA